MRRKEGSGVKWRRREQKSKREMRRKNRKEQGRKAKFEMNGKKGIGKER